MHSVLLGIKKDAREGGEYRMCSFIYIHMYICPHIVIQDDAGEGGADAYRICLYIYIVYIIYYVLYIMHYIYVYVYIYIRLFIYYISYICICICMYIYVHIYFSQLGTQDDTRKGGVDAYRMCSYIYICMYIYIYIYILN
jgi:hypothetical protein